VSATGDMVTGMDRRHSLTGDERNGVYRDVVRVERAEEALKAARKARNERLCRLRQGRDGVAPVTIDAIRKATMTRTNPAGMTRQQVHRIVGPADPDE
jgi:hypothetical protein